MSVVAAGHQTLITGTAGLDDPFVADVYAQVTPWHDKSVEAHVRIGEILLKAKATLRPGPDGRRRFGSLFPENGGPLLFSQDEGERCMKIARNRVLADSANWRNLPDERSVLRALAEQDEDLLADAIAKGAITPRTTAAEARALFNPAPEPAEPWDLKAVETRLQAAIYRELRKCPPGKERDVEALVQRLADEIAMFRAKRDALSDAALGVLGEHIQALKEAAPGQRIFMRARRWGPVTDIISQPSTYPLDMFGLRRTRRNADRLIEVCEQVWDERIAGALARRVLDWAMEEAGRRERATSSAPLRTWNCDTCGAVAQRAEGGECQECPVGVLHEQLELELLPSMGEDGR